jgi:hypothetical protein
MATVYMNHGSNALRALALSVFDRIEWRHHGIGVLQGYAREGRAPEVRLHIWSRKLLKPGMEESGDTHDHRFHMLSHVLCGTVLHEEFFEERDDERGTHRMMALTHARAAADMGYHGPVNPLPGLYSVFSSRQKIVSGYSYEFPAKKFHRSPLLGSEAEVAVTCVEKHDQGDYPARILYPASREPVMAFGHEPDSTLVQAIVEAARERLEREMFDGLS